MIHTLPVTILENKLSTGHALSFVKVFNKPIDNENQAY